MFDMDGSTTDIVVDVAPVDASKATVAAAAAPGVGAAQPMRWFERRRKKGNDDHDSKMPGTSDSVVDQTAHKKSNSNQD